MKTKATASPGLEKTLDFVIEIYREKMEGKGEDAYVFSVLPEAALIGVFDGCGGAGAKVYEKLQGKTSAYAASRIVSAVVKDWFSSSKGQVFPDSAEFLKQQIKEKYRMCYEIVGEQSSIRSGLVKIFPTTAAFAVCREESGSFVADCFWAGDSRVYLLDANGLAQISVDDLSVPDAMENLYNDGVMTNVINHSKDFMIHHRRIRTDGPCFLFSATDGCFGYVSTPMEFEFMLVMTLVKAANANEWQKNLDRVFGEVAGDDYSLSGVALGYGSFEAIQKSLSKRGKLLYSHIISELDHMGREEKTQLWQIYR